MKTGQKKTAGNSGKDLFTYNSFHEGLTYVFHRNKQRHNYTLKKLSKDLGIKSTGFMSEILSGKKRLAAKHSSHFINLGLSVLEGEYLSLLLESDHCKDPKVHKIISEKLAELRKISELSKGKYYQNPIPNIHLCLLVYTSFSLFDRPIKLDDLRPYFPKNQILDVEKCLAYMTAAGLITKQGTGFQSSNQPFFYKKTEDGSHIEFLKDAIADAQKFVEKTYAKNQESFFMSAFVSVDKEQFKNSLPEFKKKVVQAITSQECKSSPDRIISFNIQVFPKITK